MKKLFDHSTEKAVLAKGKTRKEMENEKGPVHHFNVKKVSLSANQSSLSKDEEME